MAGIRSKSGGSSPVRASHPAQTASRGETDSILQVFRSYHALQGNQMHLTPIPAKNSGLCHTDRRLYNSDYSGPQHARPHQSSLWFGLRNTSFSLTILINSCFIATFVRFLLVGY